MYGSAKFSHQSNSNASTDQTTKMLLFVFLLVAIIVLVYVYLTWNFDYWFKRGVPSPKATVLLGDLPNGMLRKENVTYDIAKIYK